MTYSIQNQIKTNKNYYEYLKENSHFIKYLNRSDKNFNMFEDFIKERYSLRTSDKIGDVIDKIELASNILEVFR